MATGRFITFEGGEGSGKTTQIALLAAALRDLGLEVVETREPGGSPLAEAVRAVLLAPREGARSALAEALLFYGARADHLEHTVLPALGRGAFVLCDRFSDSTRAYQGAAGKVPGTTLEALERLVVADRGPQLTFILDLDPAEGLRRAEARRLHGSGSEASIDAFEGRELSFHAALRAGYLAIAAAEPGRCVVVDASERPETIAARILAVVRQRCSVVDQAGRGAHR